MHDFIQTGVKGEVGKKISGPDRKALETVVYGLPMK